jgi:hypothetical protein
MGDDSDREAAIRRLAAQIRQRRLAAPARIMLAAITPLSFLASQTALLVRPLFPHGPWRSYMVALSDEASWEALQRILDSTEC